MTDSTTTRPRRRLLFVSVALVVAIVAGWLVVRWVVRPDAPGAWYTPPDELPAGPPGTIVRETEIDDVPDGMRAWRVLYTSTAPDSSPIAVSGVIVAPTDDSPSGGWPVIAWAHGTTGIASRCAPSLESHGGIERVPQLDELIAGGAVIAITDYPGLGTPGPHPYLVGESEARSVLDSIRAARSLLGVQASTRAAVFGHSQGGHAAVFADAVAADYAPDIELRGVAAMAPPTDLSELLERDDAEPAGIILTALALESWSRYYPDVDLDDVVRPVARPLVADIAANCIETTAQDIPDLPDVLALDATFLSRQPTEVPEWAAHLRSNSPQTLSATVPLLVLQGLSDELVRPDVTQEFVRARCAQGAPISLHAYTGVGHFEVRTTSAPLVAEWLLARVDGAPAATGCTTTTTA